MMMHLKSGEQCGFDFIIIFIFIEWRDMQSVVVNLLW